MDFSEFLLVNWLALLCRRQTQGPHSSEGHGGGSNQDRYNQRQGGMGDPVAAFAERGVADTTRQSYATGWTRYMK